MYYPYFPRLISTTIISLIYDLPYWTLSPTNDASKWRLPYDIPIDWLGRVAILQYNNVYFKIYKVSYTFNLSLLGNSKKKQSSTENLTHMSCV